MKNLYKILLFLVLLLSMAVNVDALEQKTMIRDDQTYASASWTEKERSIVTDTSMSVTKKDDGTYISLSVYTYDQMTGYGSYKSGFMVTQDKVFKISNTLDSASLSEIEMEIYNGNTGEKEILTVKADWVGKGDIIGGISKDMSKFPGYISRTSFSNLYREATAIGSINNCDIGESYNAGLYKDKSTISTMEK
ncbi:hypothetical protein FXV91_09750 [Methanosarcina sp. DH2]|nr:hypothetical protein [Methanosarcina sp. DH2]